MLCNVISTQYLNNSFLLSFQNENVFCSNLERNKVACNSMTSTSKNFNNINVYLSIICKMHIYFVIIYLLITLKFYNKYKIIARNKYSLHRCFVYNNVFSFTLFQCSFVTILQNNKLIVKLFNNSDFYLQVFTYFIWFFSWCLCNLIFLHFIRIKKVSVSIYYKMKCNVLNTMNSWINISL